MHFLPYCRITLKTAKPRPYPTNPTTVGDHLKERRFDLSLFQKEVALRLRVNDWTICNWENNRTTPAVCFLSSIIDCLAYYPFPVPETLAESDLPPRTIPL